MPPDEAGGTGDEVIHSRSSSFPSENVSQEARAYPAYPFCSFMQA